MSEATEFQSPQEAGPTANDGERSPVYEAPKLKRLGSILELTRGGPPGSGDSGNFQFEQVS